MTTLIGTAKGVFVYQAGGACAPARGLEERSVRHLGRVDGQMFAGADDGFYRSADGGRSWQPSGLSGRSVWDLQAAPDDRFTLYAVTEPAALFVSRDGGYAWVEIESFRRAPDADQWSMLIPAQAARVAFAPAEGQKAPLATATAKWVNVSDAQESLEDAVAAGALRVAAAPRAPRRHRIKAIGRSGGVPVQPEPV